MEERRINRASVVLGSLSIVLLVGSQYLNDILDLYVGREKGFFAPILAVSSILGLISIFINRIVRINRKVNALIFLILCTYLLTTVILPGRSSLIPIDLIGMCIIPIFLGAFLIVDYSLVFRGCMSLLLLAIPVFPALFLKANIGLNYDAVSMSTSYNILPIVLVGIIHFIYFRSESNLYDKILYIVSLFFSVSLIRMSYRGALLALVVAIVFALYYCKKRNTIRNQLLFFFIAIIAILLFVNYREVLSALSSFLHSVGIRIAFIDKSVYLLSSDITDHGRLEIYGLAFKGFLSSPIVGNGMATFEYYTGYPFPHNFILEFLHDGGVFLFVPMAYFYYSACREVLKKRWCEERYQFAFVLMIGCISITRGLVSAESWRIVLLWLFVGMALNNRDYDLASSRSSYES